MLPERFELTDEVSGLSRTMLLYSGFCSFDRREEDGLYHLVAWPDGYDGQQFDKEVYGSLVEYRACCFPPFHEDYGTNMPDCVRFDVESISYFYDKKIKSNAIKVNYIRQKYLSQIVSQRGICAIG